MVLLLFANRLASILCLSLLTVPVLLLVIGAYITYRMAYARAMEGEDPYALPKGDQYEAVRVESRRMINQVLSFPYTEVRTRSVDGLTLYGKYYHVSDDAPITLLFHGYRSSAERDFSGGLTETLKMGSNAILVDQRAHGKSEGKCLTFGVMERYDVLSWIRFVRKHYGKDRKIRLYGISMGAATVLLAAGGKLPSNVECIVSDSGYSSPEAIIRKVIRDMNLPDNLAYPLVRLGAILFGGFDPSSVTVEKALEHTKVPILFIHGEDDRFVPCEMTLANYEACGSPNKKLLTVPGAGHGISFMVDYDTYMATLTEFMESLK